MDLSALKMNNFISSLKYYKKPYKYSFDGFRGEKKLAGVGCQPTHFGIGRRKTSVAIVILIPGIGEMVVNCIQGEKYLQFNSQYINVAKSPLITLGLDSMYDVHVTTHGGGLRAKSEAIKLGVARALCYISKDYRAPLKYGGFFTRDARCKERKKYGLKKARKAPQFSKR
jgi:small subunit ribosomal protein S9